MIVSKDGFRCKCSVFFIDLSFQALKEPLYMHINNAKLSIGINRVAAYKQYFYMKLSF